MKKRKLSIMFLLSLLMVLAITPIFTPNSLDQNVTVTEREHIVSAAPAVDASASVINPDDTDNLYARRAYTFTANVSDTDNDLDHVNMSLIIDGGALQWTIKYVNSTDVFSEVEGDANIELVNANSYSNKTSTVVDLTIEVKMEWVHSDLNNVILQTIAWDGGTATTDNSSATLDVITSVAVVNSTISDSRGNPSVTDLNITGTVVYCDSATNVKPASTDCDVWITATAGNVSDLTIVSGVFSNASVPASSTVGLNTYTITVVPEAGGVSGLDQANSTYTKTYISDKVLVTNLAASEAEVSQGVQITVFFNIIREYDSSSITSGTVTLEGYTATYLSGSEWYITVISNDDVTITFDTIVISGETYGITTVNMNSKSAQVIWEGSGSGGGAIHPTSPDYTDVSDADNPFISENPDGSIVLTPAGFILIVASAGGMVFIGLILIVRRN